MIPFGYCLFRRLAFIRSEVTAEWALDAVARRVRAASCNRYGIVPRSQVWMFPAFRTRFPDRPLVAWPNKETANNAPDRTSKIRKRFYHNSPLSPAFAGQSAWALVVTQRVFRYLLQVRCAVQVQTYPHTHGFSACC